jgi:prepilin-type N-terminal cleavage/methylation domain-containing protein/prepilin-type processing-associated H-X9-DG protein
MFLYHDRQLDPSRTVEMLLTQVTRNPMRTYFRTRAFTLIELLVVIAIIAILASLLFTVLSSSRKKSNQATSLNNLKQCGAALQSSLGEHDGNMPSLGSTGGQINLADTDAWFNRLPGYLGTKPLNDKEYETKPPKPGDRSVWVNPAVPRDQGMAFVDPPKKFLFSYAMNPYLSSSKEPMLPIARVENRSATIFMSEKGDDVPSIEPKEIRAYFGEGDPRSGPNASAHFLFLDGHVELRPRKEFDPALVKGDTSNPSPDDALNINRYFTYIPYPGATKD